MVSLQAIQLNWNLLLFNHLKGTEPLVSTQIHNAEGPRLYEPQKEPCRVGSALR